MRVSRRDFIQTAAALGASLAWSGKAEASRTKWRERRELYPEGVASGDPDSHSVILWTRRPFDRGGRQMLIAEVAEDPDFRRVVAQSSTPVSAASDWTTRVLVGGLKPAKPIGIASPIPAGMEAVSDGLVRHPSPMIPAPSTSPSSAARTSMKASSMPIAG